MLRTERETKTVNALFALDDCISNLTDIQNLLYLLNEILDSDTHGITEDQGLADAFVTRFPLIRSMLNVAFFRLQDVIGEVQSTVTRTYSLYGIQDGNDAVERGCEGR